MNQRAVEIKKQIKALQEELQHVERSGEFTARISGITMSMGEPIEFSFQVLYGDFPQTLSPDHIVRIRIEG